MCYWCGPNMEPDHDEEYDVDAAIDRIREDRIDERNQA
mgnify:CR=1 FL=1